MTQPTKDDLKAFGYDPEAAQIHCTSCTGSYCGKSLDDAHAGHTCSDCATKGWIKARREAVASNAYDHAGLWMIDHIGGEWRFDKADVARGVWGTRRAKVIVAQVWSENRRRFVSERAVTVKESEGDDLDARLRAACSDTWAEASLLAMAYVAEENDQNAE